MADFHETTAPKRTREIDTVGWLFVAFVVGITAFTGMIAYKGAHTTVAKTAISVAGPHG